MADSFTRIDTDEIREIMNKVGTISEEVRYLSDVNVRSMRGTVEGSLKGEAADALMQTLEEISGDITKIAGGLRTVKNALAAYVKAVEQADAELSKQING